LGISCEERAIIARLALAANIIPGDNDGNADINFNDALALLGYIFLGNPSDLGCTDAGSTVAVGDHNGDGQADMSDAVAQLRSEFIGGADHVLGTACMYVYTCDVGCP
jgi:hypothetical protein